MSKKVQTHLVEKWLFIFTPTPAPAPTFFSSVNGIAICTAVQD